MKVLVLNGSPKGQKSVTLCSVKYLAKVFPDDRFEVLDVGRKIKTYERGEKTDELRKAIAECDVIMASYPVYTFLAPTQLHRFFEVAGETGLSFEGKYAVQLTTSKRFYDVTAHGVVKKILADLGAKYVCGLSADMEDLTLAKGRRELESWWEKVRFRTQNDITEAIPRRTAQNRPQYERAIYSEQAKSADKRVLVVTDAAPSDVGLNAMIEDFCAANPYKTDIFNVNDFKFKCGCLGCLKCTSSGVCAVNDGFKEVLDDINGADAVVMAFSIKNHALSSVFKMFFDRQFVNGHRPVTAGKPTGYIVSGDLSAEDTLKIYIDAKSAVGGNYNAGIACDEDVEDTPKSIESLAKMLAYALENGTPAEHNFYDVGGMKIFRDMIWIMRGLMKADYDFYKKNGLLDFPQKKRGQMILLKFLGKLLSVKAVNKKMPNAMEDGMLMPYEKAIENAKPID